MLDGPNSHLLAKGGVEDLRQTVERSEFLELSEETKNQYDVFLDKYLGGLTLDPLSNLEVFDRKERSKSIGFPWKCRFSNFGSLLRVLGRSDEEALARLSEQFDDYIQQVEEGVIQHGWFSAQMKTDRYSLKKVLSSTFRSIQCPEMFFNFLMVKYCCSIDETLKFRSKHILAYRNIFDVAKLMRFSDLSFGVDFTACDKHVPGYFVASYLRKIARAGGATPAIADFIFRNSYAPIVFFNNGDAVRLNGGNMSGNIATTGVNCAYHIYVEERIQQFFSHDYLCLADDGLVRYPIFPDLGKLSILYSVFGFAVVKFDLCFGGAYPSIPPFLGANWIIGHGEHGTTLTCVPTDLLRALSSLQFNESEESGDTLAERIHGVSESMSGFLTLEKCGCEIPSIVKRVFDLASTFAVSPKTAEHAMTFLLGENSSVASDLNFL